MAGGQGRGQAVESLAGHEPVGDDQLAGGAVRRDADGVKRHPADRAGHGGVDPAGGTPDYEPAGRRQAPVPQARVGGHGDPDDGG